jgi:hypothetical protein
VVAKAAPKPPPPPAEEELPELEVIEDDEPAPPPKAKTKPVRRPPPRDETDELEVLDEDPAPPERAGAKPPAAPKPARRREPISETDLEMEPVEDLEAVEDDGPAAPPRKRPRLAPEPAGITRDAPRHRPRLAEEDEGEVVEAEVDEEEGGQLTRAARAAGPVALLAVGAAVLWLLLTGLGFFVKNFFIAGGAAALMIVAGGVVWIISRVWFMRIGREEGQGVYLALRFVPFYEVYFFFKHRSQTLLPVAVWGCGALLLFTGMGVLAWRTYRELNPDWYHEGAKVIAGKRTEAEARGEEEHCAEMMGGKNKTEARAWLAGPQVSSTDVSAQHYRRAVEAAYRAGAQEVMACHPNITGGSPEAEFVIVMPGDAAARKRVFDVRRRSGVDVPDVNQKYLLLVPAEWAS